MQVDLRSAKRPTAEKVILSNTNFTEAFCEISFCSLHSSNRVEPYFGLSTSETPFLYKMQLDIQGAKRPIVEKGIFSNKNCTEATCETSYCSVHSTNIGER